MKRVLAILTGGVCLSLLVSAARAAEGELSALERQFHQLPLDARRLTGPLFWLHGDEPRQRLEEELDKVAEGGNGCFTTESRGHTDWLGPTWYRDLAICLEAAKKHDLKMWIFDEKWWPSQGVAGKVPPRYAAKRLEAASTEVEGPRAWEADGYGGDRYLGAVAGKVEAASSRFILGDSLVDLAPFIRDGKLSWQVPAGKWKIMKFSHIQAPGLEEEKCLTVNGASPDCVDWFLQTVYQPHYDRFKDEFGKHIAGFFYDEPVTYGDWGTELPRVLAEWNVDWKKPYVAYKFQLAGEDQAAARFQYLDAFAETWGRTMYGGMSRWCHAHGVASHGHFIEHYGAYLFSSCCAGDMMRVQKYSDMGGIDAVGTQFLVGNRSALDDPTFQTPKLASSISHVFGKPDDLAMVEIFGCRGQDLTYPAMKWWTDHMQVSGVNFLIPHSFNPRAPYDTDGPPYFYNGGFEPRWPMYRVWADYSSRLSLMLSGGRHVCPVALLFCGNLYHVGKGVTPEDMTTALQKVQFDCDWLPMEVFEGQSIVKPRPAVAGAASGAEIQLHGERYRVLIVPPVELIPYGTLAKAKEFSTPGAWSSATASCPRSRPPSARPAQRSPHSAAESGASRPSPARPPVTPVRRAAGRISCPPRPPPTPSLPPAWPPPASIPTWRSWPGRPTAGCTCCTGRRRTGTSSSSATRCRKARPGNSPSASPPAASRNVGTPCGTRSPRRGSAASTKGLSK